MGNIAPTMDHYPRHGYTDPQSCMLCMPSNE